MRDVVSDSSPLVIPAKLRCFDLLGRIFPLVCISAEVHHEVVATGARFSNLDLQIESVGSGRFKDCGVALVAGDDAIKLL